MGSGNLMRHDFDCLENCYLVGGRGGGVRVNLWWGESTGEGNISWWGGWANFWLVGGLPPSPSRENAALRKTGVTFSTCFRKRGGYPETMGFTQKRGGWGVPTLEEAMEVFTRISS